MICHTILLENVSCRDVKFVFFKYSKFVCKYSNFIRSSKMAAAARRRCTTAAACPTSLDQSPSRWSTPDQAAITNGSQPTSAPQPMPAASLQQPTDSKDYDHRRVTIVSRYVGYFDVAAGRETPRWVGWTGLDGRMSLPRLLLIGFEYRQTNVKYVWKIAIVIVTRWLTKHKWYWF